LDGAADVAVHPASGVRPVNGKLVWLLDEAAASVLGDRSRENILPGVGAGAKHPAPKF
jgi:hypothetical protein